MACKSINNKGDLKATASHHQNEVLVFEMCGISSYQTAAAAFDCFTPEQFSERLLLIYWLLFLLYMLGL